MSEAHKHLKITECEWVAFCRDFDDTMIQIDPIDFSLNVNGIPVFRAKLLPKLTGCLALQKGVSD
jgi:hypothetical protein